MQRLAWSLAAAASCGAWLPSLCMTCLLHTTWRQVHNFLALITIGLLGSEDQKKEHLGAMARYEQVRG